MKILNKGYTGNSGIYISVSPDEHSKDTIREMISKLNPPFPLDIFDDEAHMTIMYSRSETIDEDQLQTPDSITALPIKFEYWDGHDKDGYLVLKMVSEPASHFHQHLLDLGAEHSFDDYTPHMTIIHGVYKFRDKINEWLKSIEGKYGSHLVYFNKLTIDNCKQ